MNGDKIKFGHNMLKMAQTSIYNTYLHCWRSIIHNQLFLYSDASLNGKMMQWGVWFSGYSLLKMILDPQNQWPNSPSAP